MKTRNVTYLLSVQRNIGDGTIITMDAHEKDGSGERWSRKQEVKQEETCVCTAHDNVNTLSSMFK